MDNKNFQKILSYLQRIERNQKITNSIKKEKTANPVYPDLNSLIGAVESHGVPCRLQYKCMNCLTKKRNKCWKLTIKQDNKKNLLKGIPYDRDSLSKLQISGLWILAAHFKIQTTNKSRSNLVDLIMKKQYKDSQKSGGK